MDYFKNFITHNFILLFASVVMLIISIQKFKQHQKISLCSILVIAIANILAINNTVQDYAANNGMIELTFTCSIIGYTIRPACIYLLIIMSRHTKETKLFWLTAIPLGINFFIYLLGLFPATRELVVYYVLNGEGKAIWVGDGPLRFSSHVVSLGYLVWLVVTALGLLKSKHLSHGLTILTLSFFVVLCVVIESFFNEGGEIELLNTTIALGVLVYYLYLYIEKSQIDALTGLFNRETYYHDILKMGRFVNGVIEFDMNGLKYINDNFGHFEGDKALSNISKAIVKCSKRNMYAYRLGGDEFTILAINTTEEQLVSTIESFKAKMKEEKFRCSIGYAYKDANQTIEELSKIAEERMYKDKSEFYKNSHIERRKADQI